MGREQRPKNTPRCQKWNQVSLFPAGGLASPYPPVLLPPPPGGIPSYFRDAAGEKGTSKHQTWTQRMAVGWPFSPYRQLQVTRRENEE